jgi:hypothetical protein
MFYPHLVTLIHAKKIIGDCHGCNCMAVGFSATIAIGEPIITQV